MARSRGTLHMIDGRTIEVTIAAGDKLRARREAGGDDADTQLIYSAYSAYKRQVGTELSFEAWADTVEDFEPIMDERAIHELEVMGEVTAEQAKALRELYGDKDAEAGEALATSSASSSASPSGPDSPSATC